MTKFWCKVLFNKSFCIDLVFSSCTLPFLRINLLVLYSFFFLLFIFKNQLMSNGIKLKPKKVIQMNNNINQNAISRVFETLLGNNDSL